MYDFSSLHANVRKSLTMQFEESTNQKLFVNKPLAKGYNVVEKPDYDNLKKEKRIFT